MSLYGSTLYGTQTPGRAFDIARGAPRTWGAELPGTVPWGYLVAQSGEVSGDAIGIGGSVQATVGQYAILSGGIGIAAQALAEMVLVGSVSGEIGIGAQIEAQVHHKGEASGNVGIGGNAAGYIVMVGEITGPSIGIAGQAFGYSGAVPSYDKVGARLATEFTDRIRARVITEAVAGRFINATVRGRF